MCTKQLDQLKYFNTKIQELTSNFVRLLKKKKKQYFRLELSILGTQKVFFPDP